MRMRTFMSALHRAHLGAWASRRDLGFCSGVTYVPPRHPSAEAVSCVQRASSRSVSSTSTPPAVARRPHCQPARGRVQLAASTRLEWQSVPGEDRERMRRGWGGGQNFLRLPTTTTPPTGPPLPHPPHASPPPP